MTARKLPPRGDPCGLFLSWVRPSPRPPPEDGPPTRNKTGGGRPALREKPALPGWGYAPGEFENSPPLKGDLREVPLRGKGSRPPPRKTGRALFPEERYALLQIGSYSAGLGKPGRSGGGI